jgi:hypothetical protein
MEFINNSNISKILTRDRRNVLLQKSARIAILNVFISDFQLKKAKTEPDFTNLIIARIPFIKSRDF